MYEEVLLPSENSTKTSDMNDYLVRLKEELRKRGEPIDRFRFGQVGAKFWKREFGRQIVVDVVAWHPNTIYPILAVECSLTSTLDKEVRNLKETPAQAKTIVRCNGESGEAVDGINVYSIASFERRVREYFRI